MDGNLKNSPELAYPIESGDAKFVSGLSTILVATIQEAKDRISQIEYIFCSQLYPNFQSKSKTLQKICSDARKAAEDKWKEKEHELLLEIENLHIKNQHALQEKRRLKLEIEGNPIVQEENSTLHLSKQNNLDKKIFELEQELRAQSKENDEGLVLQSKLIQLVQSKTSVIMDKGMEFIKYEGKLNGLLTEVKGLNEKADDLQEQLKRKTEEMEMGNNLLEDSRKRIESQGSTIIDNEEKLNYYEKENKLLNQQLNLAKSEMLKSEHQMKEHEEEKNLFLSKITSLEGKVEELQNDVHERNSKMDFRMKSYEKILQGVELKESELEFEKNKKRDIIAAYKRLKSQYNKLLSKAGLTMENTIPQHQIVDDTYLFSHSQDTPSLHDQENENPYTSSVACNPTTINNNTSFKEKMGNEIKVESGQVSSSRSPNIMSLGASKCSSGLKPTPLAGMKRPASHWRETRSNQRPDGPDPHDDFLDTPLEKIKGNWIKAMHEEVRDLPVPMQKNTKFDSSDDETQDLQASSSSHKQPVTVIKPVGSDYKFVEPVRKKAERENLKGVECNQCKKFYDAVLPDDKNPDSSNKNLRCEHHDGVSRHRYRYAPPLTPEGFWNIGFDSEM